MGERTEWAIGEAPVNANYRVSGRQAPSGDALAEKRAKDRVILKLVGLHGLLYSEEEADEFKSSAASVAASETASLGEGMQPHEVETPTKSKGGKGKAKGAQGGADELKRKIDKAASIDAV